DVRRTVAVDVIRDLVHDVAHVTDVVPRRPHGRTRAEGALVRASARSEDRHRPPEVDAVAEPRLEVPCNREEVPGRTGDVIDVPDALTRLGPRRAAFQSARDAFDVLERTRARDVRREIDDRLFALTDRTGRHRSARVEDELPCPRDVLAPDEDRTV